MALLNLKRKATKINANEYRVDGDTTTFTITKVRAGWWKHQEAGADFALYASSLRDCKWAIENELERRAMGLGKWKNPKAA